MNSNCIFVPFLSLPIFEITLEKAGASAVVLASQDSNNPTFSGLEKVAGLPKTDFRIFGKPSSRPYRRMGVVLVNDTIDKPITEIVAKAKAAAQLITINS